MYVFVELVCIEHLRASIGSAVMNKINKDPASQSLLLGHRPRLLPKATTTTKKITLVNSMKK